MYLDQHAINNPDRDAIIMASTGKTISYREFEGRANQLAHVLRSEGLQRLHHYSILWRTMSGTWSHVQQENAPARTTPA